MHNFASFTSLQVVLLVQLLLTFAPNPVHLAPTGEDLALSRFLPNAKSTQDFNARTTSNAEPIDFALEESSDRATLEQKPQMEAVESIDLDRGNFVEPTAPVEQVVGLVHQVDVGPVQPTNIGVFVVASDGNRYSLEIEPTESIARLKQAIENSTKVSADDQRLFLDEGSVLNEDDRTLDSYGISKDSTILQVFHPQNAFDVAIETSSGHVFTGVFQASDTTADVKREIGKRSGIPFDQQVLSLVSGNQTQTLDDEGRTLESYGIESGSSIAQTYLPKADLRIAVETSTGHSFVVNVKRSDQVELIKREIDKRDRRIPFDEQQLAFAGEQLENDRTLGSYNISTGAMLSQTLRKMLRIMIEAPFGRTWELAVDSTQLIDRVKLEIERRDDIPVDRQRLMFAGRTIESGRRLDEYKISTCDTVKLLVLAERPIKVVVDFENRFSRYSTLPGETVLRLKTAISRYSSIPIEDQIISFTGKVLCDDKTLGFYNITSGETLQLRRRSKS